MNEPHSERCLACGKSGRLDEHHPTGRDHNGAHFDPAFTVPLCPPCHQLHHAVLRASKLEKRGSLPGPTQSAPFLMLCRLGTFFLWLSWQGRPVTFSQQSLAFLAEVFDKATFALFGDGRQ